MNKAELVASVAKKSDLTKKESEKVVDTFFNCVEETLVKGDKLQLVGFGTFETKERAARKGRNPQTGEEIDIPESRVPSFKPGKQLKENLNV
ncbi:MAG: HU family DNA-binding protein [Clostridiales bacterium]|nr:HU family DNA-binding protein [Clostridiales bacterium]MCF8022654.1 HU family DNA-binding protein [Clostridiales bacterium]